MTISPEQHRKMLECAANACGLRHVDYTGIDYDGSGGLVLVNENGCHTREWNPRAKAGDTAEMCAKLGIGTRWYLLNDCVVCGPSYDNVTAYFKDHDNSRLKAWMHAATLVAAKTQGYEE